MRKPVLTWLKCCVSKKIKGLELVGDAIMKNIFILNHLSVKTTLLYEISGTLSN